MSLNQLEQENNELRKENERLKEELVNSRNVKYKVGGKILKMWIGADLTKDFKVFLEQAPNPSTNSIAQLLTSITKRLSRIGIISLIAFIIPILFLALQTFILYKQNEKFDEQNIHIQKQIVLEEASRRSNLILLMDNILKN